MKNFLMLTLLLTSVFSYAQKNWVYKTDGMVVGQPLIHNDQIYVLSGQSLSVLKKNGELIWQYSIGANTYSSVEINNGQIYVLADDGVHALNQQGEKQWFFPTQDKASSVNGKSWGWGDEVFQDPWSWYRSSPVYVDGKIVFGNASGTYAISAKDGTLVWHIDTGVTHTKPAVFENMVYVGSWNNKLYAIDVNSGAVVWEFISRIPQGESTNWIGWKGFNLSPTVFNGVIYVGNRGTYFYAIDAKSGVEKWSSKYAGTWIGSPAIESDGILYFGTSDGMSLIGHHAKSGAQTLLHMNDFYNFAQPQADESRVFYASLSGRLYSVDKKTWKGTLLYSTSASRENYADLVKAEGGLKRYYSGIEKYSNQTEMKDIKRMHNKLGSILSMTLHDGVIYLGGADGNVHAINLNR